MKSTASKAAYVTIQHSDHRYKATVRSVRHILEYLVRHEREGRKAVVVKIENGWPALTKALQKHIKRPRNEWKSSDIRIRKDSAGYFEASHRYQGHLYDWTSLPDRKEARRVAVEELKHLQRYSCRTWDKS